MKETPGNSSRVEFHLERVVDDLAIDADAHGPVQLDARMEIGEHRKLPVAVHIGARHPNNRREEYVRCRRSRPPARPAACQRRDAVRRSNSAYTASAQHRADRVGRHVFPRCVAGQRLLDDLAQESRAGADESRERIEPRALESRMRRAARRARRASRGRTAACGPRSRWCGRRRSAQWAAARTAAGPPTRTRRVR